ncbi:adenylate/guanylate cyclase domain-containing protein [Luteolibacter luteus]|uniref:Adenylate/guanylate cyclase domain-containing protein n=1 Tax=Luteolibacter luteus TaxID=2728835 RepID=A0A858RM37_9BACT|nr:adenylate/guanylate cyclase domain-containing protein [Luteolibacter luteus]QJE97250.1 adenylate/guanylate cyclase domain-containing protein [Luteolibacter luteus]
MTPPTGSSGSTERRVRLLAALVGIVLAISAGYLGLLQPGGPVRTLSYDLPFIAGHRSGAGADVRIVYIDDLDGRFIDRRSQAKLLDILNRAGVRAAVYDLIFDRPSEDPAVDREFAAAMLRFRGIDEAGEEVAGATRRQVFLACGRNSVSQTGANIEQLVVPTDELLAAADDFGLVALVHDRKFTVRELTAGTRDEPSMTWKAAVALGAPLEEETRLNERWINYAGPPPDPGNPASHPAIPSYNASDLLNGDVPVDLAGKVVVIGAKPGIVGAALGIDLFNTPFHRFDRDRLALTSGVEVQATILSNLKERNWLNRADKAFDDRLVILAGIFAGAGFTRLRPLPGILAGLLGILLLGVLGTVMVHYKEIWFLWSVPAFLQIPVAVVWGGFSHFYVERFFRVKLSEEQRQLREAFAKYVSPQMLDRLTAEGFRMKVGGEKIHGAMMFTDLENFTNMCERVGDPEKIVATLNDYFERTTCHIFDDDGVVIKFIGDAIFAAWGAPLPEPQSALKAARAAWKLGHSAKLVIDGVELQTRIGVHYGEVVAGNIGSVKRVDYTMIGDAVNLASRLESLNKTLGTNTLISEEVRQQIDKEFRTRLVGRLKVKGRKEITVVHELLGPQEGRPEPEWLGIYGKALELLHANDPEQAEELFRCVERAKGAPDGPSAFYLKRLADGDRVTDGVVEMTEK